MKMGKPKVKKSEETNRQINSDTKCSSKQQTAEKGNEWPDWLPDGWDMEVRTRKSGPLMGSGYKCYIDSLNGNKFYSKPEVLRYLETTKGNNCTSKKKKCTRTHFPSKEGEKHINKHSPSKEEAKCNDKHPPNKEEEKCTNSSQHSPSKDGEKCINMHSPSNAVGEKSTVEDLPLGWIKEVKIRKNGNGIKKDWFYTDPVSGYVFRSKMDVLRYLESGDIGKCAIKPSRSQYQDEDNLTPSPAAKRQKPKQSTPLQKIVAKELVDKSSLELPDVNNSRKGQHVNVPSEMMVARDTSGGSVVKMHLLEDGAANSPEMKKTSEAVLKYESLKVNHSNHSISKNNFNVGYRFSRRLAGIEPVKLADNVINDQTILFPKRNLRKNRTTPGADMESKSSQHFNGVTKIEQPEAMNTGKTISEVVFKEQPHQLEKDKIEGNKPEIHTNSNKSSKKKELLIPRRASKRLAGSEHGLMNSIFCEKASKYKSQRSKEVPAELQQSEGGPVTERTDHAPINGESGNKRIKSPKILPVAENQLEKLEADDEKSEPPLSFAFHYSWSDPCLEFAINTLTGVLPPIENSVDNGSSTVLETDIQKPPFDTFTRSRGSQNNSVDNGPTTIHETDIQKTLFDNVTVKKDSQNNSTGNVTRSRDKNPLVQSNKSKRKKEAKVPMRLSKRLAGLEPEASPSDKALEYSSRKSCKEEPSASATVLLTNGASHHLYAGEETKLTHNESDSLKTEVVGESSRKRSKSYDAQTVPKEQHLEKVEAKNIGDDRSKLTLPFGESWSDPCLEFAFKTLTGALPVDSAAQIFKVTTPDVNDPPNNELHGRAKTSINGKARDNSNQSQNKKERNMDCQSSELLLGQLELRTSSISGKNVPKFTTGESHSHESNIIRNLFGEPLYVDDPRNNELHGRVTTSINGKSHDNSNQSQNKKEQNMNGQPSELLLGQPELRTSSISSNNVPKLTTGDSHSHESNIIRSLFGEYVDDPPNNELHGRATTIINGEAHDNSNQSQIKIERNMDGQPSELLLGQPELRTTSISGKDVPKFTAGESHNHESNIIRSLFGEPLYVEAENATQLLHHPRTDGNSQIHEEPIKNNGQVTEGEFRTTEPPSPLQTETLNHDNAELQFCESFMNSWSDPCLEFAFKTLTGALPVDSAAQIFKVTTPDVNDPPNNELHGRAKTSINGKARDNSNQSQNKKERNMDCQSSELLLGQLELRTSSISGKNVPKFTTGESHSHESNIIRNLFGEPLYVDDPRNNELHGRVTTSINGKSHDNSNQSQNKKEQNMNGQPSELLLGQPELRTSSISSNNVPKLTTGDSHSHESNIIRSLFGEYVDDPPNNELHGRATTIINGEAHDNSNQSQIKIERNMDGQPSELLLGQPELRTTSISGKDVPKFTAGESHNHESNIIRSLFGEPLYVEAENATQLLHHPRTDGNSQIHEEPIKNNGQVTEGEFRTTEPPSPLQTETLNHDNAELQFCESFMNSWSDPCLEFAFKTLTGVIPVEENLAIQGSIEEPANFHEGRDGGLALPDFGSSSFSQSDFSFHYDTGVNSMPGQQSSMSSSFPSLGLHGCSGVDPQQQYSQCNINFQRR